MDLNAVKMFVSVVQAGSFISASQKSGVPIATLSRKVSDLEQYFNVQLLERSRHGVKLTFSGQQLFEQAGHSIEVLNSLEQNVKGYQQQLKGRLRLSMPQAFELWWEVLHDFQRAYPQIDVHIVANNRKLDLTADGIDVAIRIGDLETETLVAKKVFELELKLVASSDFVATNGQPNSISELPNFPLACWTETAEQQSVWTFTDQALKLTPHFSTNDYFHLRQWVKYGNGICELPAMLANPLLERGELVQVLPEIQFPAQPIHLIYPSHRHPSSLVRAYVTFCQQWLTMYCEN